RPDRDAAVCRTAAEIPPGRARPWRVPATGTRSRTRRDLFRSAANLVRALRARPDLARDLSTRRRHPAADVHVPRLGFAERLVATDHIAQLSLPAPGYRRAARYRRRGLGHGHLAPRADHRAGEIRHQHTGRH